MKEGEEIIIDKIFIVEMFNIYFINIVNYIKMLVFNEYGYDFVNYFSVVVIK